MKTCKLLSILFFTFFLSLEFVQGQTENCSNGTDDDNNNLIDCYEDCSTCGNCASFYYQSCLNSCSNPIVPATLSIGSIDFPDTLQVGATNNGLNRDWHQYNTPIVGDLDGDGMPEVVGKSGTINTSTSIIIHSGDQTGIEQIIDLNITGTGQSPIILNKAYDAITIGDADGDTRNELYVVGYNGVLAYLSCYEYSNVNSEMEFQWQTQLGSKNDFQVKTPSIHNIDLIGSAEIVVGNVILDAMGTIIKNDPTITSTGGSFGLGVVADLLPYNNSTCTSCDGLELAVGNEIYSIDLTNSSLSLNLEVSANSANNTENVNLTDGNTSIADINGDGVLDVVVTTTDNTNYWVYAYNPLIASDNLIFYSEGLISTQNTTNGGSGSNNPIGQAMIGEMDNNSNSTEISFTLRNRIVVLSFDFSAGGILSTWFDSDLVPTLTIQDNSGKTGATLFDFNGDGNLELVYRDAQNMRIIDISDPSSPTIATSSCVSGTGIEYPVVVDADNNGTSEILCSCGGNLRQFTSGNTIPWLPARPVWNQHNYFNVNVNDDLSIPLSQQIHSLPGYLGNPITQSPLNKFLVQHSNPNTAIADLTVEIDSISCPDTFGNVNLFFTINNLGTANSLANTSYSIYDANPTINPANLLFTNTINNVILPNNSVQIQLLLQNVFTNDLFVVVNDDGNFIPLPYDLNLDFSFTGIWECDYSNNLDFKNNICCDYNPTFTVSADTLCDGEEFEFLFGPSTWNEVIIKLNGDTVVNDGIILTMDDPGYQPSINMVTGITDFSGVPANSEIEVIIIMYENDTLGCSDTLSNSFFIEDCDSFPLFPCEELDSIADFEYVINNDGTVTFTDNTSSYGPTPDYIIWIFPNESINASPNSTIDYEFEYSDSITVCMVAAWFHDENSDDCCFDTICQPIYINNLCWDLDIETNVIMDIDPFDPLHYYFENISTPAPANNYMWSIDGGSFVTSYDNTFDYYFTSDGEHTIIARTIWHLAEDSNLCCIEDLVINIVINDSIDCEVVEENITLDVSPLQVSPLTTRQFTLNFPSGLTMSINSINWDFDDVNSTNPQTSNHDYVLQHTFVNAGMHNVCAEISYTTINGIECLVNKCVQIEVLPFNLTPNPANKNVYINYESSEMGTEYQYEIYDVSGKLVTKSPFTSSNIGNNKEKVVINFLSHGTYYLSFYKQGILVGTENFIKE